MESMYSVMCKVRASLERKKCFYECICILMTVLLTGCSHQIKQEAVNGTINDTKYNHEEDKIEREIEREQNNSIEYDEYIGKIWIYNDAQDDVYSFTITALNQCEIEGRGRLFGTFMGTVEGNKAEFDFEHEEDSGNVEIELLSPDEIIVKVTYSQRAEENRDRMETVDKFRPYHLSDIEPFIPNDQMSFGMELDSMGYRYFAAGMYNNEVRPSAALYMRDKDGNIYYDFYVAYINLMEIVKLSVEDINEDGRSDIRVWIAMKDKSLVPFFQEIFLQNRDGTFSGNATVVDLILYGDDAINFQKEKNAPKDLPNALENEIKKILAEDSFYEFIEKYQIEYRQLSDVEKQEYSMTDETGLLAYYYLDELKTRDDAWFVADDTGDLMIQHEEDGGKYSYYNYQCEHGRDAYFMRAVGLNEEFYMIRWNEETYLVTTKHSEDKVTGIAVYCMHGEDSYGWLMYQEKTGNDEIMTRYYSYIEDPKETGTYWPEYEFLCDEFYK